MKILYVINGLGTGGAERSLAGLLPHLAENGDTAVIAALSSKPEGVEAAVRAAGTDVRVAPATQLRRAVPWLRRILASEKPDVVHTTIFEADVAGRLAAIGGPPVVTSLVNTSYDPGRVRADPNVRRWKLEAVRQLDGLTARHLTEHFHAITQVVADAAVRDLRIDPGRISVIERGRDPARFTPPSDTERNRARRELEVPDGARLLVNVGRQEHQKGQRFLLEALPAVLERHPDTHLILAGREGNATSTLNTIMRGSPVRDRIRLVGHLDDVRPVLRGADVFVFSSLYEGLGGALIEAMGMGLPIVASDLPVLREVVATADAAVFARPADAAALAGSITRVLNDPGARTAMGQRAHSEFLRRFTLERSATRMLGMYRQVADQAPRPSQAPA